MALVDGETAEEHRGQRVGLVTRCASGGLCPGHDRCGRRVVRDHPGTVCDHPGTARPFSLIARCPAP